MVQEALNHKLIKDEMHYEDAHVVWCSGSSRSCPIQEGHLDYGNKS